MQVETISVSSNIRLEISLGSFSFHSSFCYIMLHYVTLCYSMLHYVHWLVTVFPKIGAILAGNVQW